MVDGSFAPSERWEIRILEAKVRVYGECSDNLYEYTRATYNRVKARLACRPEVQREGLRQEAYRSNARARSAVGQAAILSGDEDLRLKLEHVRHKVGDLNHAVDDGDLRQRHDGLHKLLKEALERARHDLMR